MATQMEDVLIRQMKEKDIDSILEIDKKIGGLERAFTYENLFDSLIGGEIACSFVAEVKNHVVGFILASVTYVPEEVTRVCMIQILGVHPGYRRQRIASRLIGALAEACSSKGIREIRVMVDQHDTNLQGLFETLDFRRGSMINYSLALP